MTASQTIYSWMLHAGCWLLPCAAPVLTPAQTALSGAERLDASSLSKREVIRRLGTSATQFYRLLDQTNTRKSIGQLLSLLHILDCDVELVVKRRRSA